MRWVVTETFEQKKKILSQFCALSLSFCPCLSQAELQHTTNAGHITGFLGPEGALWFQHAVGISGKVIRVKSSTAASCLQHCQKYISFPFTGLSTDSHAYWKHIEMRSLLLLYWCLQHLIKKNKKRRGTDAGKRDRDSEVDSSGRCCFYLKCPYE